MRSVSNTPSPCLFELLGQLKSKVEKRLLWDRADRDVKFFECHWKPNCWRETRRFIFIHTREPKQHKGPLQLNLFAPYAYGYQFKVILTNATLSPCKLLALHNGRGAQEAIFSGVKSQAQIAYIPCKRRAAN